MLNQKNASVNPVNGSLNLAGTPERVAFIVRKTLGKIQTLLDASKIYDKQNTIDAVNVMRVAFSQNNNDARCAEAEKAINHCITCLESLHEMKGTQERLSRENYLFNLRYRIKNIFTTEATTEATTEEIALWEGEEDEETPAPAASGYILPNIETARRSHECNHMLSDFSAARYTAEYTREIDTIRAAAARQIEKVDSVFRDQIRGAVAYYERKRAQLENDLNRVGASYAAWFIAGPSKYNVKKSDAKNRRMDDIIKEIGALYDKTMSKIRTAGTVISSDNGDALRLLRDKLEKLQARQKLEIEANKYWRKNNYSWDGYRGPLEEETKHRKIGNGYDSKFFTENNAQEIRRIKERIAELEKRAATNYGDPVEYDGGRVEFNQEENRLQLIFYDKPDGETRETLKKNGFRWSPRFKAWQRQLNSAAIWAAKNLGYLPKEYKATTEPETEPTPETVETTEQEPAETEPTTELAPARVPSLSQSFDEVERDKNRYIEKYILHNELRLFIFPETRRVYIQINRYARQYWDVKDHLKRVFKEKTPAISVDIFDNEVWFMEYTDENIQAFKKAFPGYYREAAADSAPVVETVEKNTVETVEEVETIDDDETGDDDETSDEDAEETPAEKEKALELVAASTVERLRAGVVAWRHLKADTKTAPRSWDRLRPYSLNNTLIIESTPETRRARLLITFDRADVKDDDGKSVIDWTQYADAGAEVWQPKKFKFIPLKDEHGELIKDVAGKILATRKVSKYGKVTIHDADRFPWLAKKREQKYAQLEKIIASEIQERDAKRAALLGAAQEKWASNLAQIVKRFFDGTKLTTERAALGQEIACAFIASRLGFDLEWDADTEKQDAARLLALCTQGDKKHETTGHALQVVLKHANKCIASILYQSQTTTIKPRDEKPAPAPAVEDQPADNDDGKKKADEIDRLLVQYWNGLRKLDESWSVLQNAKLRQLEGNIFEQISAARSVYPAYSVKWDEFNQRLANIRMVHAARERYWEREREINQERLF